MLEEIEYNPDDHALFAPNIENVTQVVTSIIELLDNAPFTEMRVLDILLGLEAVVDHLKTALGVSGMTAVVDGGDDE